MTRSSITPENYQAFANELFSGFGLVDEQESLDPISYLFQSIGLAQPAQPADWFVEYLTTGNRPETPERQAFVDAFDKLMVGFLYVAPNLPEDGLVAFDFSDFARDQTVTDHEFAAFLMAHGFADDLEAMGDYGLPFVLFAGGIMQGIIDNNQLGGFVAVMGGKYSLDEFQPFYSPAALQMTHQNASSSPLLRYDAQRGLDALLGEQIAQAGGLLLPYVIQMEGVCGTPMRNDLFLPNPSIEDRSAAVLGG